MTELIDLFKLYRFMVIETINFLYFSAIELIDLA